MDAPLQRAVTAAGGVRLFFRKLGLARPDWRTTPRARVFQVALLSGVLPEDLRPDLAEWIGEERTRRELAEAMGGVSLAQLADSVENRWSGPTIDAGLTDLWASLAAVMFVARERRLKVQAVCHGKGAGFEEARAYAMALAHVVGRATSTNVANIFGCTRQNVDNASERYVRSRDGDDADDHIQGQFADGRPRVMELGSNRLRLAKDADPKLWSAQQRFEAFLRGEDLQPQTQAKGEPHRWTSAERAGASRKEPKSRGWAYARTPDEA